MHDNDGQSGTSESLTEDTAAPFFESLLSDEEDKQETEEPPVQKKAPEPESETADEDEASTEQAEAEEDKSEEGEEPEEVDAEQPQTFTTKINGEEVQVTLDELLKGYSRTSDYTRKTQEIAEQRKQLETQIPALRGEREKLATYLTELDTALRESTPEEPDWAKVQSDQPDEFPKLWAHWQAHKDRMNTLRRERDEATAAVMRDRSQAHQEYVDAEKGKLLAALPDWKDAKVAKVEKKKLTDCALEAGYSQEEIDDVTDHRVLLLLRDAMKWRESQKKKPAIREHIEKVKVATPGAGSSNSRTPVTDTTRAKQRLAKTGRQEDAARLFETMLPD